jgi:hypothetical protein
MNMSSVGSLDQVQQQMQMRKMDGSGGGQGHGKGGMNAITESLSSDQANQLKSQMSELSVEDRQAMMQQMKEVDSTSTESNDDYFNTLMSMFESEDDTSSSDKLITEVYA